MSGSFLFSVGPFKRGCMVRAFLRDERAFWHACMHRSLVNEVFVCIDDAVLVGGYVSKGNAPVL